MQYKKRAGDLCRIFSQMTERCEEEPWERSYFH